MTAAAALAPTSDKIEVAFRPAGPLDEPLVNSAFLRGLRDSSHTFGLSSDTFFAVGRQAWAGIQRDFETTIAHAAGDPDEVAGYVTHWKDERGVPMIAWLYVAKAWRKFGIATKLLAHAGVVRSKRWPVIIKGEETWTGFPVLFASPQKLAMFRSKGYYPAFVPYLCWKYLRDDSRPRTKLTDGNEVP